MLFDTAFNTVFDKVKNLTLSPGYKFSDIELIKLVTGYADDIGVLTNLNIDNQEVLDSIQEWLEWSKTMKAKPKKCKATSLNAGKPQDPKLSIAGQLMQWIEKDPFKFLGKQLLANASDSVARAMIKEELERGVALIDKLRLLSYQKMWIFDAVLMSMLSWSLLIHDMSCSFVKDLEAIQTQALKRWSHYPKHSPKEIFYRSAKHHGWHMKQLVPFFKKMQLVKCHLLKTSSDEDVRLIYESRSRREQAESQSDNPVLHGKWQPTQELESLCKEVHWQEMVQGARATTDTSGLGFNTRSTGKLSPKAEERKAVLKLSEAHEEEKRYLHCLQLGHFSEWVKWDGVMAQDRNWNELIRREGDDELFRFSLAATEDVCPTPSVLKCWRVPGMEGHNVMCHLCGVKQSYLSHILAGCNAGKDSALQQGRYTWRHDSVLLALYKHIRSMRNAGRAVLKRGLKRPAKQPTKFKGDKGGTFVAPCTSEQTENSVPLFEESDDWELLFDLDYEPDGQVKNQAFPAHIATSSRRPDALMFSNKLKKVVWIELTSPWEDNCTKSYARKKGRYNKLEAAVKAAGWTPVALYVEVGARGYINDTWGRMSKAVGMKRAQSKALRSCCGRIAQRCSYFIYLSRKVKTWNARKLVEEKY